MRVQAINMAGSSDGLWGSNAARFQGLTRSSTSFWSKSLNFRFRFRLRSSATSSLETSSFHRLAKVWETRPGKSFSISFQLTVCPLVVLSVSLLRVSSACLARSWGPTFDSICRCHNWENETVEHNRWATGGHKWWWNGNHGIRRAQ